MNECKAEWYLKKRAGVEEIFRLSEKKSLKVHVSPSERYRLEWSFLIGN